MDNKEWLKNLQNEKEQKRRKENNEKKEKANKKCTAEFHNSLLKYKAWNQS